MDDFVRYYKANKDEEVKKYLLSTVRKNMKLSPLNPEDH